MEHKLKAVDARNRKLTPWEEYKEKRARKKRKKKEAKVVCSLYWLQYGIDGLQNNEAK